MAVTAWRRSSPSATGGSGGNQGQDGISPSSRKIISRVKGSRAGISEGNICRGPLFYARSPGGLRLRGPPPSAFGRVSKPIIPPTHKEPLSTWDSGPRRTAFLSRSLAVPIGWFPPIENGGQYPPGVRVSERKWYGPAPCKLPGAGWVVLYDAVMHH